MNTEINEMQPTRSLKSVIEHEVRNDPFTAFIKYPLCEVRRSCLKRINEIKDIYSYHAEWAEAVIERLRKNQDRDYWKEILEWYLNAADDKNWRDEDALILRRAIEFALSLSHDEERLVSKLLTGRLKKATFSVGIYDEMSSLKKFFHGLLRNIFWEMQLWRGRAVLREGEYSDEIWYQAVRALEVAVLAGDFSLIDDIGNAIFLMEEGVIYPARYSHWSAKDTRIAYLKAAKECLEEAKSETAKREGEEESE